MDDLNLDIGHIEYASTNAKKTLEPSLFSK